jgi:hypothetical protein
MTPELPCCLSLLSQTAQAVLGVTELYWGPSRSRPFGKGDLEFTFKIPLTDLSYKIHFASLDDPDSILETFFVIRPQLTPIYPLELLWILAPYCFSELQEYFRDAGVIHFATRILVEGVTSEENTSETPARKKMNHLQSTRPSWPLAPLALKKFYGTCLLTCVFLSPLNCRSSNISIFNYLLHLPFFLN